jgi:hypothetical protein
VNDASRNGTPRRQVSTPPEKVHDFFPQLIRERLSPNASFAAVLEVYGFNDNYRLYFAGQGIPLIGTWMTRLATGWLVYRLGGRDAPRLLGLVGFVGQVPTFFLAPLASC